MSEEKKYKYLVDVCELAEIEQLESYPDYNQEGMYLYCVTVKLTDKGEWKTFHNMFIRKEDDILFFMSRFHRRVLVLCSMSCTPNSIKGNFELKFKTTGHDLGLDSEFVKGLKKISSVDEIEKSHGDEPGERGECFGTVVVLDIFKELDLITPIIHQRGNCIIAEVCCNEKLAEFHRKYDSYTVIFQMKLNDGIRYFTVEREGEVITDSCLWILKVIDFPKLIYSPAQLSNSPLVAVERDGDNVSFSVPMLTYKREDVCGKLPQLHRARINKPKSI